MTDSVEGFEKATDVPCPVCGAKIGEPCSLITGEAREKPHIDRRFIAKDGKLIAKDEKR
jgi:hypothetical protein